MNNAEYIKIFLNQHNARIDENNRIHIQCLCDSTFLFLQEMVMVLRCLGCTDIQTSDEIVTEGIPENKPWCNCLYKASGLLPEMQKNCEV